MVHSVYISLSVYWKHQVENHWSPFYNVVYFVISEYIICTKLTDSNPLSPPCSQCAQPPLQRESPQRCLNYTWHPKATHTIKIAWLGPVGLECVKTCFCDPFIPVLKLALWHFSFICMHARSITLTRKRDEGYQITVSNKWSVLYLPSSDTETDLLVLPNEDLDRESCCMVFMRFAYFDVHVNRPLPCPQIETWVLWYLCPPPPLSPSSFPSLSPCIVESGGHAPESWGVCGGGRGGDVEMWSAVEGQ